MTGVQTCALPIYEVCATTPSVDLVPYQSEYEGYMGNYGNTLDRWYRRAALVIWPRNQSFANRAQASSVWALDELDELVHAYAMTIHRSQGSEYPAVVIPLTTSAWMMLQRNLLYTAITRAKKLVVLVGSRRALAAAVRTVGAGRRHTALTHRLKRK